MVGGCWLSYLDYILYNNGKSICNLQFYSYQHVKSITKRKKVLMATANTSPYTVNTCLVLFLDLRTYVPQSLVVVNILCGAAYGNDI